MRRLHVAGVLALAALLALHVAPGRPRPAAPTPHSPNGRAELDENGVLISFSRPVVEPDQIGAPSPISTDVPGRAVWTGVASARFTPASTLPPSRDLRVASPFGQWTLRTPEARSQAWLPSETGPRPRFEPKFDRPVDLELMTFDGGGSIIPARVSGGAVEPAEPLPLGTSWELRVGSFCHSFDVCAPLRLVSATGEAHPVRDNSIELAFSNAVDAEQLKKLVSIRPPVPFSICPWGRRATLTGKFAAGSTIWVRIAPGLRDGYGNVMGAHTELVTIPAHDPAIRFTETRPFLPRHERPAVPLWTVNVPEVRLAVRRMGPEPWKDQPGPVAERILAAARETNDPFIHGVDLPGPGIYRVTASAADMKLQESALYQVTGMALTCKRGRESTLACVTRFEDGSPMPGVHVALHGELGEELARAETGADGCALLPTAKGRTLAARSSDDAAWLDLRSRALDLWRLDVGRGRTFVPICLLTDRPIYRPGETVHVKGWSAGAPASTARLELRDPQDELLDVRACPISPVGGLNASFALSSRAVSGGYRIVASIGDLHATRSFDVACYRPPPFQVSLCPRSAVVFRNDPVEIAVEARAFFGSPMRRAEIEWSCWIEGSKARAEGRGRLDELGRIVVRREFGSETGRLTFRATVRDEARQPVSAEATVDIEPADLKIELRAGSGRVGEPMRLDLDARPPREIGVILLKRTWSTLQQLSAGGGWSYVSQKRDELVDLRLTRPGSWSFTPRDPGHYVLQARGRDDAGRERVEERSFDVGGAGEAGWARRDDSIVEVTADRSRYRVGERARLLIRGGPRALVTLEREGVMERFWTDSNIVEIPIRPEHRPNLHVGVLIPAPAFGYGYATLEVESEPLPVAVRAPVEARPGDLVRLEVQTAPGAEVAVAVIDDSILALVDRDEPDPHSYFASPRPLEVRTWDAHPQRAAAGPLDVRGKKGRPGGDGGSKEGGASGESLRRDFRGTALWLPETRADGEGRAAIEFRLPDNLTRWRVDVSASTGNRWGHATTSFESRKDRMLVPIAPRFAHLGDRFVASALVRPGSQRIELPVVADRLGRKPLRFAIEGDAVELSIPVVLPAAAETERRIGRVDGRAEIEPHRMDQVESVTLTLASNELAWIHSQLHLLQEYPHGCVEQTSSKTIPQIALGRLGLGGAEHRVNAGVARLLSMQRRCGGFAYWPDEETPSRAGSVCAAHTLVLARQGGYFVPEPALTRALDYLESSLRDPDGPSRSYALYVLSMAGRRHESYLEALPRDGFVELSAIELGRPLPAGERRAPPEFSAPEVLLHVRRGGKIDIESLIRNATLTYQRAWSLLAAAESIRSSQSGPVKVRVGERVVFHDVVDRPIVLSIPRGRIGVEGRVCYALHVRGCKVEQGPEDRGFWIRRAYVRAGEERPSREFRVGDLIQTRVFVCVSERRRYVALEDPRPAGFETVSAVRQWGHFEHRDDRSFASWVELEPGVHELSYLVRAAVPGTFSAPAPRAEEMYAPHVCGRGSRDVVVIRP